MSAVTARLARALGIEPAILPATDDRLRTWIDTPAGSFAFQEWFVARGHRDEVDGVRFEGEPHAAPGVLAAIEAADAILIAPSNPYVSIWPILAVPEIRAALEARRVPCVAVSPLVGGRAVKGPADRMLARMAGGTTPEHVAGCYSGLIDALVVDESDPDRAGRGAPRRDEDADDRPGGVAPSRRDGARGGRMKVAVVGGTGKFGQAVAKRLVDAGLEVVIGSRDARAGTSSGCRPRRRRGRTTTTPCAASTSSSSP